MSFSNYLEDALLKHAFKITALTPATNLYVALYTGDPTEDGTSNEVTGTGYVRKVCNSWSVTSVGTIKNSGAVTFAAAGAGGWGTVNHVGVFDTTTGGNFYGWGSLTSAKAIAAGDVAEFADATITITLD